MDYNGDILNMVRSDILVNQVTKNGRKNGYKLFLFKMRSKSDKLRHYEISNSIASENFIKAYLTKESNFILLSNNRFYMYDNETKKKRCLMNLNDSEPQDFIYFKEHIIFIQKNKFSLFQSKTNGKFSVMLNLKDIPLKVNFCSHRNMLYLSTCRRLYFLKLIYLKDKTLKVKNTNMSLPFKSKKEKYVYHSYKNKFYKINNEYKEVIHVCGYSDKDIIVYKFVKGKYKNKKKCLIKLSANKLNNEMIKGSFFFKINTSDKEEKMSENFRNVNNDKITDISDSCYLISTIPEENLINGEKLKNGNESTLLSSNNSYLEDKKKEKEIENNSINSLDSLNINEYNKNGASNIPFELNTYIMKNEKSNIKTQKNNYNEEIKEYIIKLYLLIYTESGKILIYFIDYLNQDDFKFGFVNIKKNPIIYMQLPFKTSFIYNVSDVFSKRVTKQRSILQKKKKLSKNYNKYIEHIMNKEIYVNSNFFIDAIIMNDKSAKIYTIQIHHDYFYQSENSTNLITLNVIDSNNKIIAIKNVNDNEQKKKLIDKVINESKFSCYSDSDSFIDSEITWEDSDNSDEKSFYSESDSLIENDLTDDEYENKINGINNFTNNINKEDEKMLLEPHLNGSITNEQNEYSSRMNTVKKIKKNEKMEEIDLSVEKEPSINSSLNKDNIEFCSQEYYAKDNEINGCKEEINNEAYELELKNCCTLSMNEKKKLNINNNKKTENYTTSNNNIQMEYNENVSFLNDKINECLKNEKLLNGKIDDSISNSNESNLEDSSESETNKNISKNQDMPDSINITNSNDNLSISSSSLLFNKIIKAKNSNTNENKVKNNTDEILYDEKEKNKKENICEKNFKDENEEEKLVELKKIEGVNSYHKSQEIISKNDESGIKKKGETIINNDISSKNEREIAVINEEIEQKIVEKKEESRRTLENIDEKKYENVEVELDKKFIKNKGKKDIKAEDEKENAENTGIKETKEKEINIGDKDENIKKKKKNAGDNETEVKANKEDKSLKEKKTKSKKIKETDEIKTLVKERERKEENASVYEEKKISIENKVADEEEGVDENEKMSEEGAKINEEKEIIENIKMNEENTEEEKDINKIEKMNKENGSVNEEKGIIEKKEKSKKNKKRKEKEEKELKEDIKEQVTESKIRKIEDEFSNDKKELDVTFNDLGNNYKHGINNKSDKDLVNSNDKFLIISSMIKLNISLKRYSNVIELINTKDTKLIKKTITNLGKKNSIKLLEFLLNSLTKSKFFINTFYIWIKIICKVHKDVLKEKKYRRLVTKISGIAMNNLKNENIVKHVVEKINYTIDHIIKNQVFDNVEILNYKDGTIIK